jgi:hypothetical protein
MSAQRALTMQQVLMATLIAMGALAVSLLTAGGARADGFGVLGAARGIEDPPYRYLALTPHTRHPVTVVERLDLGNATVDRWWYLHGSYYVPAVAYDGTPGGLSANGGTLVLITFPRSYPPQRTRLAILDTRLFLRHPHLPGQKRPRHAITHLSLRGAFSFDAISPDGSLIYLIQNFYSHRRPVRYQVRALETASGRLLPQPIVDPKEPDERMQGSPISRVSSPNGRWAYTLYAGSHEIFLHALDTVRARAICVDLPGLEDLREPFLLRLRLEDSGRRVVVYSRSRLRGDPPPGPLRSIDTHTFAVQRLSPPSGLVAKLTAAIGGFW